MANDNDKRTERDADARTNDSNRGFNSMEEDKQRDIASKSGKAPHQTDVPKDSEER